MDTLDMRYWNERAVKMKYKTTVPGVILNSYVSQMNEDGREGGMVCGRMCWWWKGTNVDWC